MDRKAWVVNELPPYPWTLWMKPIRKVGQWVIHKNRDTPREVAKPETSNFA